MAPRDPHEEHRTSTPLELFFDLTFVVAVAQAGTTLHHEFVEGHASDALVAYPIVFFAVWWAWMNFTWFASAYDCDDALYRVTVFVQMAGVLVLAAGLPALLRRPRPVDRRRRVRHHAGGADRAVAARRSTAVRPRHPRVPGRLGGCWRWRPTAVGGSSSLCRWRRASCWCRCGPSAASARRGIPRHIAERYGLFTIIVLGESVLAATVAVQVAARRGRGGRRT